VLTVAEQHDWRKVLAVGVLPHASAEGLASLADALRRGDPRLLRRRTVEPLYVCPERSVTASCPLAWLAWRGRSGVRVKAVEGAFERLLARCDEATGSKLAVQSFLAAWDAWGEDDVPLPAAELLEAVEQELARRAALEMVS
jgi:hypothetical protein